ncbi:MAG: SRPBCC domain-containing protein [Polyangiaceae bacterium]
MMQTTIDQETFTIAFERQLPVSRVEVFDAWTKPEQIAAWWDPSGARLVTSEIDLRPGGAFRFVNDGHGPPFSGTYAVVERPTRLVFEAMGSVGTVTLETEGNGTRMSVTIRCASKEQLEHFVKMGIASNTDRTLDNLIRYVGGSQPASAVP